MSVVTQNINRLNHLLSLFRLSTDDLLTILSNGLANRVSEKDVFSEEIKLSNLKKIDKIFNKGLSYYVDPSPVNVSKDESIFFRKDSFNASLRLSDIQFVNKYEEKKLYFESVLKLSDIKKERIFGKYSVSDNPAKVASEIRKHIYPSHVGKPKDLLKSLISNLADHNILVFEYVESPKKLEKANVNGFYLSPDVIVLKWQKYTKRELFTLVHELGHYLLEEEEIDENINVEIPVENLGSVENWCNEFAFKFLIGSHSVDHLSYANSENDYHHAVIEQISSQTHLSELSLYTRLLIINKISSSSYNSIVKSIHEFLQKQIEAERAQLDQNKMIAESKGEKLTIPAVKPIISPLYLNALKVALHSGVLNEYEFCSNLSIKPEKLDDYLV